ncbi:MAG: M20 family metallopeptidase [Flavobacteriales bacterium]
MIDRVKEAVARSYPELVRLRRHLHAHPELSFQETRTMEFVTDALRAAGIEVRAGVAVTGAIATIKGEGGPGDRLVALRADLDALPITEQNTCDYRSTNPGVMHACGHDAHTAMVMGAGLVLHELRKDWRGTVQLVFQPGEEKIPGGAQMLLNEHAFGEHLPDGIIAQHVTPELVVGKLGFCEGPFMASSDELYVTVIGKGGHAAMPEKLIDPIKIASTLLLTLRDEVAKRVRADQPWVMSFGKVIADGATNVIPNEVQLTGTLRAFDESFRSELHTEIPRVAQELCSAKGGSCDFEVRKGYPVLINDPALTARLHALAIDYLGADNVVRMDRRMGSEDFSFYTHVMPGCLFRLGTGVPGAALRGLHTPTFDIDEAALAIGCGMMALGAMRELAS